MTQDVRAGFLLSRSPALPLSFFLTEKVAPMYTFNLFQGEVELRAIRWLWTSGPEEGAWRRHHQPPAVWGGRGSRAHTAPA